MGINFINRIIDELKSELQIKFPQFRGIYLFGSYAIGTAGTDSDVDLAIVMENKPDINEKKNIREIIYRKMLKYNIIIDNPILSFSELLKPDTYLKKRIVDEGKFYER